MVNFPGWLYLSAIRMISFQTLPATSGANEFLNRLLFHKRSSNEKIDFLHVLPVVRTFSFSAMGNLLMGDSGSFASLYGADILGVIGHAHEIKRLGDFDLITRRMLDWLAERILIGVLRAS